MARFVRHWEARGIGLWAVEHKVSDAFISFIGLLYQNDWPEGAPASLRYGFEELGGRSTSSASSIPRTWPRSEWRRKPGSPSVVRPASRDLT